jgi:CrcB protein
MPVVVGVAVGGALGASSRYLLDTLIERNVSSIFPWATFTINITGCLLIGLCEATIVDRHDVPAWVRVGIVVGVLGGYTTFSTYAQESLQLFDARDVGLGLLYTVGSVATGVLAAYLGSLLGRQLV